MTAASRRAADELPGNPGLLDLEYRLSQPAMPWEFHDALEEWTVSVVLKDSQRRMEGREVGSLTLIRLRENDRYCPLSAAEDYDLELSNTVLGIFDAGYGGYRQPFKDAVESPSGDLLVLYRARLDEAWRGFGIGPALAAEAIWTLGGGCCAAVVAPRPTERRDDERLTAEEQWRQACVKLDALWESIGFRRYANYDSIYVLDLTCEESAHLRNLRRKDVDALAEAYDPTRRR
ncbi:hypothetical protein GCM10012275_43860 [Longimycelium tulufanense]|uniref:Uncharacterized protein n=1 Tax=Longimycelium tulufanense TaxID=907463 RepID=A0A8J3CHR3_9PSEU|nr:hypothetical protein [Longimycelium tulufanense]GGM68614.1 hypothetical protein GCM10012275_43860 [Longimycelium tulufanense]